MGIIFPQKADRTQKGKMGMPLYLKKIGLHRSGAGCDYGTHNPQSHDGAIQQ